MERERSRKLPRSLSIANLRDASPQLITLFLLLALLLATGGSSRNDVPQLVILRPVAVCVAGFGLATISRQTWRDYRSVFLLFGAIILLTVSHLVPLPPGLWQSLPGRQIIVEIDRLADLGSIWRPLSMFPEGTWNALYSLSVPMAVLLLASQLNKKDQARLLFGVLIACFVTGLAGVAQAAGWDFYLYRFGENTTPGLFANRNHQAAMLACAFPMLAALALIAPYISAQPRALRLIAAAGAFTLIPLILVTGSRMGFVAAVLAFTYAMVVSVRQRSNALSSPRKILLLLLAAVAAAAGALIATISASRDIAINRIDADGEELRWPIWQAIIDFLPEYMPWGSGIGSFVPVYQIHEPSEMLMPQYVNQAHNDFLDIVLTSGVPGVVLMIVGALMLARATGRALASRGGAGHLKQAGVGIIFVLAVASLSDYPVRTPILSALAAIAAIWASAPTAQRKTAESQNEDVTP